PGRRPRTGPRSGHGAEMPGPGRQHVPPVAQRHALPAPAADRARQAQGRSRSLGRAHRRRGTRRRAGRCPHPASRPRPATPASAEPAPANPAAAEPAPELTLAERAPSAVASAGATAAAPAPATHAPPSERAEAAPSVQPAPIPARPPRSPAPADPAIDPAREVELYTALHPKR